MTEAPSEVPIIVDIMQAILDKGHEVLFGNQGHIIRMEIWDNVGSYPWVRFSIHESPTSGLMRSVTFHDLEKYYDLLPTAEPNQWVLTKTGPRP